MDAIIESLSNDDARMDLEEGDVDERLIGRGNPTKSDMPKADSTPNAKKLRSQTREEKQATTAALVELFNDDSDDDKAMQSEDPLIEVTTELTTQTRREEPATEKRTLRSSQRNHSTTITRKDDGEGVPPSNSASMNKKMLRRPSSSKGKVATPTARVTRSRAHERNTEKNENESTVTKPPDTPEPRRTRSGAVKVDSTSKRRKTYRHDSLGDLSSESEWDTTDDDESSDEFSSEQMGRRTPLKPINAVPSKPRKRNLTSNNTMPEVKAKRPRLSLSSKRTGEAKKVRTVEKKRTPKKNGATATPSRRKVVTPHIPQRKKGSLEKITNGSKVKGGNQYEAAKERYL